MDHATLIVLVLDEGEAKVLANDKDHIAIDEHFGWGEEVTVEPITIKGRKLVQLTLNGELPEWLGSEYVHTSLKGIALTYGTDSTASNFLDVKISGEHIKHEFKGPVELIEAARLIERAAAKARPVKDETIAALKERLKEYGVLAEEEDGGDA